MSRFFVIGAARTGKSTMGRALADALGTKATDTSSGITLVECARQGALAAYDEDYSHIPDWDAERDRPKRALLIALGDAVKQIDPTIWIRYCFDRGDVCVGVRRRDELAWGRAAYPDARVIYIRSSDAVSDNFDIPVEDLGPHDIVYDNLKRGVQTELEGLLFMLNATRGMLPRCGGVASESTQVQPAG